MPLGWAWLMRDARVPPAPLAVVQAPAQKESSQIGAITIRRGKPTFSVVPVKHAILENAEIAYGETVLSADRIELYQDATGAIKAGSGFAKGHVQITDPIGLLSADDVSFNWLEHTGQATNAVATVEGVRIDAAKVDVLPGEWRLDGIRAGFSRGHSLAYATARHATIRPGTGVTAYSVNADLLGQRFVGFHHVGYEESGHFGGDRFPVPTLSGDHGVGLRYRPLYLFDERTAGALTFVASQTELPSYGAVVARSFLPSGEAHGLILPRYDLDMRFDFGYFDNVGVSSPTEEHHLVSQPRDNISADAQYNVQAFDRKGNEVFAKPFESTFERSFGLGSGFSLLTDNTVQNIHSLGGSDHTRFLDASSLELPVVRLAPMFTLRGRLDGATYQGGNTGFSWVHSQLGLIFRPNNSTRFGAAYVAGKQYGTPLYQADQLYSVNGFDFRGDFTLGPRGVSLLFKYDTDRGAWYDRELLVSQVMGPLQAFVRFRTFPSQFIFGAQIRVDSAFSELLKRNPSRPKEPPKDVD